jgi:zona occludens toxin
MPINAYTGLMGSGKTYEVVMSVILPAIKAGRDVVTNIHGLNQELIYQHLEKPNEGVSFGRVKLVKNEQVISEDFFPQWNGETEDFDFKENTIVRGGDVVAIDEAWRPWGTDSKCIKFQMSFFREHRHCVNDRGVTCDLAVITQDITDIHKLLKNVVEMSFVFTKLKTLGMAKRYRIQMYEGSKLYKTKLTSWSTSTYDKKIFPLYKSFASDSGGGVEKALDSRQNILKSGAFLIPVLVAITFIAGGAYYIYGFFHREPPPSAQKADNAVQVDNRTAALPATPQYASQPASVGTSSPAGVAIAGAVTIGPDQWAVLIHPDGLRIVSPSMIRSNGVSSMTKDENKAFPAYLTK